MQKFFSLDKLQMGAWSVIIKYKGSAHDTINPTQVCVYYTYESRCVSSVFYKTLSDVSGENNVRGVVYIVFSYFMHGRDQVIFIGSFTVHSQRQIDCDSSHFKTSTEAMTDLIQRLKLHRFTKNAHSSDSTGCI